jgi:DNA-binding CsgD family transcriptional regulator
VERRVADRRSEPSRWLRAWADGDLVPRAVVALDGRALWTNVAAVDLLERDPDLSVSQGVVGPRDPRLRSPFLQFLRSVGEVARAHHVRRAGGDSHLILIGRQLRDRNEVAVRLTFRDTARLPRGLPDFGQVFQLTRSEAAVVGRMLDGATAEEVATALAISVETVRTHIRNVYGKIEVNSREALFRKLAPYVLTD